MSVKNVPTVSVQPKKRRVFYPETDGKPMAEGDVQRNMMFDIINPLDRHFKEQPNVYVTGNIMFYYIKGDNRTYTSPDAMVVKGVPKGDRRVFCLWRERPPCVIFEVTSDLTYHKDFEEKFRLYEQFGVPEYYIFDPEETAAAKAWTAFRLVDGAYQRVTLENGRIFSPELGLEIVQRGPTLRFLTP